MKGAVLTALCAIALARGATVHNQNGCPLDYSIDKLFPHPDCTKFFQCVHGFALERSCPLGLHFSTETEACDFPIAAKCEGQIIQPEHPIADLNLNNEIEGNNPPLNNYDDPSQAPAICAEAGSDGVLVAHEICNRFYKCSFGVPVAMRCPSVLFYDFNVERCEWPETVKCGDRILPDDDNDDNAGDWTGDGAGNHDPSQAAAICAAEGSDHTYIAHENCNQYYKCWAGKPVALFCPGELLFDAAKDYCEWPYMVDCGDRGIVENPDAGNENQGGHSEEEIPEGNNHDDPSQANAICRSINSEGVLIAHENCNRFYQCSFGTPVAQICPGDLLFDPRIDRCEWPNNVICGDRIIPEKNETDNEGPWTGNGANNDDPSQAPAICAAEGSDHVFVAHENCNQFYQCWAGRPFPMKCPENFLFNPKKDYCDWPDVVDCGDRVVPKLLIRGNKGEIDDDENEDDIPVGNNFDDPSQAPAICRGENSTGILIAHENCNQFYVCDHGLPVAQTCFVNLLFNPVTDRCDWRGNVTCGNRVVPPEVDIDHDWNVEGGGNDDPSQAPAICAAEDSDNVFIAHENCSKFYQCWAGRPVVLDCQPGLFFDPAKDYCDWPYNVDCGDRLVPKNLNRNDQDEVNEEKPDKDIPVGNNYDDPSQAPAICRGENSTGILIAHENCNQFYVCDHGLPVAQTCFVNLLFNPVTDRCDWRGNVTCGNRVVPPEVDIDHDWNVEGGGNDDPSQAPAICAAEDSDNVFIAHENCSKFYQCWAGRPVVLDCQPGLFFDPAKDYCDWPYNVDCGDRLVA